MLRAMFGMGGTEILVILIVALLFLGPDKLPEAAKKISKGIRDIKKQSRVLQRTIEDDEHIGGAIRDLKSALRGEDEPYRPPPIKARPLDSIPADSTAESHGGPAGDAAPDALTAGAADGAGSPAETNGERALAEGAPALTLPPTAGESDAPAAGASEDAELAALVKPAPNTIARGANASSEPESDHG